MNAQNLSEKQIRFRIRLDREPDATPMYFWVSEKTEVMVVKVDTTIKIFNAICPHMGARLCYQPAQKSITCPWHGLSFNLEDQKSNHSKYRHVALIDGEVRDGYLIIYG
jgi:nitrite reductase/ring-hydroxylating ferredoxin subunit